MRKFLIIFAALILISGCFSDIVEQAELGYKDDYSIYNKVLQNLSADNNYLIVLSDSTQMYYLSGSVTEYFIDNIPGLSVETIDDYILINKTKAKLSKVPGIIHIFESEYSNSNQKAVHVAISRVGYNSSKTQAIVSLDVSHGPWTGSGSLVYLELSRGEWQIKKTLTTWIS